MTVEAAVAAAAAAAAGATEAKTVAETTVMLRKAVHVCQTYWPQGS